MYIISLHIMHATIVMNLKKNILTHVTMHNADPCATLRHAHIQKVQIRNTTQTT